DCSARKPAENLAGDGGAPGYDPTDPLLRAVTGRSMAGVDDAPNVAKATPGARGPSGIHAVQALTIAQDNLTGARKSQHALAVKLRKRPRDGFQGKAQIIAD